MLAYDPDRPPRPDAWLAIDEGKRLELADAYHRGLKLPAPHARLHSAIHVVVENQLAIGETTVVETLARLRGEGLSRHDAIHAIGSVLTERLVAALRGELTSETLTPEYLKGLRALTAESWKSS